MCSLFWCVPSKKDPECERCQSPLSPKIKACFSCSEFPKKHNSFCVSCSHILLKNKLPHIHDSVFLFVVKEKALDEQKQYIILPEITSEDLQELVRILKMYDVGYVLKMDDEYIRHHPSLTFECSHIEAYLNEQLIVITQNMYFKTEYLYTYFVHDLIPKTCSVDQSSGKYWFSVPIY